MFAAPPLRASVTWKGTIPPGKDGRTAQVIDCSTLGSVAGELVFCSYAIDDSRIGRDDFVRLLDGRVALVVAGLPDPSSADPDTLASSLWTKIENASRRGAIGVIVMPNPRDNSWVPRTGHPPGSSGIPCISVGWELALDLFSVWDLSFEIAMGEFDLSIADPDPLPGDGAWEDSYVQITIGSAEPQ